MFDKRWFLFDFARGRKLIKKEASDLLCVLERAGYNGICIHLEGFFETDAFPGIVRDGYLTKQDAGWFINECKKHSMKVIPIINLIGHTESFVYYQERFTDLMRDREHHQLDLYNPELENFSHTVIDETIEIFAPEYLHIGGDECALNEEEKSLYARFLSSMCEYVRSKNIVPCVWSDMLYEHKHLTESFTKEVALFDWWYNGHRTESLEYFKEQGFKEIFACPSDQGWDGFIGVQRKCPWPHIMPKDTRDILPFEAEAFLQDAKDTGLQNGLFTDWENRNAHNLWSQMAQIVRSGLFMADKEYGENSVEAALFGRKTPFTKISFLLSELQLIMYNAEMETGKRAALECRISDALFDNSKLIALYSSSTAIMPLIEKNFETGISICERELDGWDTLGDIEDRCKRSLLSTTAYAKALFAFIRLASYGYKAYHEASLCQFDDLEKCCMLVKTTAELTGEFANTVYEFYTYQQEAIKDSGQTKKDILVLNQLYLNTLTLAKSLKKMSEIPPNTPKEKIPVLPSFSMLINETLCGGK